METYIGSGVYLLVIPLYMAVLYFALDTLRLTFCANKKHCDTPACLPRTLRLVIRLFLVMAMVTCLTFALLQSTWIIGQGYTGLSDSEMAAWVVFDWVNGVAYLTFVLAIRLYYQWHRAGEASS